MEQLKKRIKDAFAKAPKFELVEMPFIDVSEDPVRPELSLEFRQAYGRKIYGIKDEEGDIAAIMCFAFTNAIPTSVEEMLEEAVVKLHCHGSHFEPRPLERRYRYAKLISHPCSPDAS